MNKEKYCIPKSFTLREAMTHIDTHTEKFAIILNSDETVAGVLTDGNIRRALISGTELTTNVTKVMQKNFVSCNLSVNASQALKLMEEKDFSHLPIITNESKFYAMWSRKELQNKISIPNPVVIMSGGLGTRLGSLTHDIPKPMLPVAGRPILEIIIETFRNAGFQNFYLAVNYKAEIITDYFKDGKKHSCNIKYLHEHKRLGTAGALSLLPPLDCDFIVANGDVLTHMNPRHLLIHHITMQSIGTMLAKRFVMQVPYGVVESDSSNVLSKIREKPSFDFCVNAGMNVFSPKAISYIPLDTFFDMPELFNMLIKNHKKTQVFETEDYWLDVGQVPDYERAQKDYV